MEFNSLIYIILGISILMLIGMIIYSIYMYISISKTSKEFKNKIQNEIDYISKLEYSEKLLTFINTLAAQVTILKFRSFIDNHDMSKVTKANVQRVVAEVAESVHSSINVININFDDTVFTKEFLEKYIVEISSIDVKKILDKTLDNNE